MKKLLVMFFLSFLVLGVQAQDSKEKKEKSNKEKKDKGSKKAKDDAEVFIGEPEGDDYQLEDRKEISKPSMPMFTTEQEFNQMKKKKEQQDAYMNNEYYFPSKPKNAWQVGLKFGTASVNGDVETSIFKGNKPFIPGYTVGAYVKKSFNYMFSLRLNYHYMTMWNNDAELSTVSTQMALKSPTIGNFYGAGSRIAHNSKTVAHDVTMDAIVSFGNVKYHKERTRVLFNIFASAGGMMFQTWYDHLDANGNAYDYNSIDYDQKKKEVNKDLEALRDGDYETRAERSVAEGEGFLGSSYQFLPTFGGGAGLTFRLNRVIDLDLEVDHGHKK
jgi:OOP family OmpA-OmpF porin